MKHDEFDKGSPSRDSSSHPESPVLIANQWGGLLANEPELRPVQRICSDDAAVSALELVSNHFALVKTVKNGDWLRLVSNLAQPPAKGFRTSFSLLPPNGRMHLYGQPSSQCAGLLFDRRDVDLSSALCFASGYFAKTEQHLHVEPDGQVLLTGGRAAHLSSVEALIKAGVMAAACNESEPPLYNELSVPIQGGGTRGLAAVFVRTDVADDALFAMGLLSLLEHVFPHLPLLPLLRLTGTGVASIVTRQEQLELLRCHANSASLPSYHSTGHAPVVTQPAQSSHASCTSVVRDTVAAPSSPTCPMGDSRIPRLPIDALAFPELSIGERLALHTTHGIDRTSLRSTLVEVANADGVPQLASHVAHCLCAAAQADNVASAREIVRTAAPLLIAPLLVRESNDASSAPSVTTAGCSTSSAACPGAAASDHAASSAVATGSATPFPAQPVGDDDADHDADTMGFKSPDSRTKIACTRSVMQAVATLQRACSVERSNGMLVALGAQITISEFVAGRTAQRLEAACKWLEDWCVKASMGVCSPSALVFLLTSWMEAKKVDGNSDWASFLSGKAVANRRAFHDELTRLLDAQRKGDGVEYIKQLYVLSSRLRKPCLRLRILQQVLGLDTRFSRDTVHGVICLAFDVLEEMGAAKVPSSRGQPNFPIAPTASHPAAVGGGSETPLVGSSNSGGMGLDLDGYDEATRLEADALLGSGVLRRPSDPLGEASRRGRVMYYYR